ncbi:hypothetical protein U1Q18_044855, partial [Sarracenia purpurea var. burkii]
ILHLSQETCLCLPLEFGDLDPSCGFSTAPSCPSGNPSLGDVDSPLRRWRSLAAAIGGGGEVADLVSSFSPLVSYCLPLISIGWISRRPSDHDSRAYGAVVSRKDLGPALSNDAPAVNIPRDKTVNLFRSKTPLSGSVNNAMRCRPRPNRSCGPAKGSRRSGDSARREGCAARHWSLLLLRFVLRILTVAALRRNQAGVHRPRLNNNPTPLDKALEGDAVQSGYSLGRLEQMLSDPLTVASLTKPP